MKLAVKLFARARDLVGTGVAELELPEQGVVRVGLVRQALVAQYPALAPLVPSLLMAIGNDYAHDDAPVPKDAEIACFPPVSGG